MINDVSNETLIVNIKGNNNSNNFIINGTESNINNSLENDSNTFTNEVIFKDDIRLATNQFIKIENNYDDNITQSGLEFRLPDNKSLYFNAFSLMQLEEQLNIIINKINELSAGHDNVCLLNNLNLLFSPSS